ncbi:unnamed protein product [Pylaiella littoralis]
MAPHIYRVAAEAYKSLHADARDQCVIVTGESGAGKTEAAKQLMHFVTTAGTSSEAQKATMEGVQRHLLESNPILEAFGNAQTIRNDNSSRFGKYMELQFSFKGVLRGGKVTNYLLEKSRVAGQAPGERCFHVMHYLLEGASAREQSDFRLLPASEYAYLMKRKSTIPGVDDGKEFENLKRSMLRMEINSKDQSHMFPLLAGVLAAGNLCFDDHGDGNAATVVQTPDNALTRTAACLGVDATALEAALTSVTLMVGQGREGGGGWVGKRDASSWIRGSVKSSNTKHHKNLNGGDAAKNRDAMAKELYRRLFGWIVDKVNRSIECASEGLTMGILDIYGFEIFEHNDFEQFCINYVNEKLQQYFIDHTIRAEQDDYEAEGVEWEHVDYFNNKTVCDMIEGRQGLLSLLDEVSSYKSSGGASLVNRYNRAMANHDHYFPGEEAVYGTAYGRKYPPPPPPLLLNHRDGGGDARSGLRPTAGPEGAAAVSSRITIGRADKQFVDAKTMFGIRHFAGNVTYGTEKFIEKNADRLHRDLVKLLSQSTNPLAAELFQEPKSSAAKQPQNKARRHLSLSAQFKKQVDALCGSLARCQPNYVRCIKPNSTKTPLKIDETMLTHQVTYLGLRENVRVRRQGYAFRMPFGQFVRRYGFLSESTWPDRVLREFWPDGTPYDPAQPEVPGHLITYDEITEEFQEMREAEPDADGSSEEKEGVTDSSDDGVTDKEAKTPPVENTPLRSRPHARSASARILQTFTPARSKGRTQSTKTPMSAAKSSALLHKSASEARPSQKEPKRMVTVTSTRVRKVQRRVEPVERLTWERRELSERQATFAILEEGRPKRWESHRTGGKTITLNVPKLCADSGDIKVGKTKIFIKHPHTLFALEDQRQPALFAVAAIIQAKARGFVRRWRYIRFLAVIGKVAAVARGFLARQRYGRILDGVSRAQAAFRGNVQRARYKRLKAAAKGRPLRYYALRIQRNYRGYKTRSTVHPRTLRKARSLGAKMVAAGRGFRAAVLIQSVWRMHVARKEFLEQRRKIKAVQAMYRRTLARREFEKLREEDYRRTINDLKDGISLVKHTVGTFSRMKSRRTIEITYTNDGCLAWDGLGVMRRDQRVNVASDVRKVTKGVSSRRLSRTGESEKGDDVATTASPRRASGTGKYLVLHQKSGKTLDLECANYAQRDSLKRAVDKIQGKW